MPIPVLVITGKDKGKIARVMKVLPDKNRALVEKVNLVKRHTKPSQKNRQGGIVEKEASIHLSNLMLVDPKTGKRTRVGFRVEDGKTVRVSVKSREILEVK